MIHGEHKIFKGDRENNTGDNTKYTGWGILTIYQKVHDV
jgi:hypothetical protein